MVENRNTRGLYAIDHNAIDHYTIDHYIIDLYTIDFYTIDFVAVNSARKKQYWARFLAVYNIHGARHGIVCVQGGDGKFDCFLCACFDRNVTYDEGFSHSLVSSSSLASTCRNTNFHKGDYSSVCTVWLFSSAASIVFLL